MGEKPCGPYPMTGDILLVTNSDSLVAELLNFGEIRRKTPHACVQKHTHTQLQLLNFFTPIAHMSTTAANATANSVNM